MFEDEPHAEGAAAVAAAREALQALCQELNLDEGSAAEALDDFTAIRGNYSLEGEVIHWLACSLYVACRKSIIPTVGKGVMEGNCVSLTRILRSAKLSLIQFFSKMKKWMDMSNLPQEFRERIERLERNFEVSTVIFKKFEPIFLDIFQNPYEELPKLPRSRKQRRIPCSVKDLFNFCWTLFVYTKGNFRMIGDDLVNSYHLLLCCLDLIFANAIMCPNRRDLLNPSFKGLPSDFHAPDFKAAEEPPCIIAVLCDLHDGLLVEAKGIKEHYFKPYISKLFDKKVSLVFYRSCMRNPMGNIIKIVKGIGETFCQHYTQSTDKQPGSHIDFAVNRLKLAEILYYKILETIMVQETRRLHGMDMSVLLEQDIFHRSLMACCLEIVLFAYSSPRTFPWIIEVLDLQPFYFYKVIEVVIRSEEGLSRDMVKHLNSIEEQILESLAWTNNSALWEALHASANKVPSCEEVIFPNNFEIGNGGTVQGHLPMMPMSPIIHPRVKEVRTDSGSLRKDMQPLSPISVHERYSSPAAGSAKRRLFGDDPPKDTLMDKIMAEGTKLKIAPSSVTAESLSISPGQALLTMATTTVTGTMGRKVTVPLHGIANDAGEITLVPISMTKTQESTAESPVSLTAQSLIGASPKQTHLTKAQDAHLTGISKPKRTGSLALFYRKVYHLASVRLRDLCLKLDVSNELRRKIWTCFEFTLVHCPDLMKDRHLDQLLLCAFYIMAKVTKEERTFQEIMKSYRNQPQANSHVYRSVLLKSIPGEVVVYSGDYEMTDGDIEDATKTPNCSSEPVKEERGDLIKFYNTIYVGRVKSFALKYDLSNQDHIMDAPPLSPFPHIKQQPGSPRRISQQHSIYVSPHKNGSGLTPRSALLYKFNGSPSKSLKDINNMIRQGEQKTKKRVIAITGDAESPAKRLCQENDDVLLKRLQDVVSERANH
ncbi:retinoblastoma-like protein 1 [Grammomys surdaster]|uniref:retinoblastoma-like protein 1 n=1 Tax=Grammomys surdaster TaxID=491861 RepID=UPI00109FB039|nr:retinoblastoma-like protein 1 [Grammomys surdaster]